MTLNLEELETLLAAATPDPWFNDSLLNAWNEEGEAICSGESGFDHHDLKAIVALRNAAPTLIARVRELEEEQEWQDMKSAPKDKTEILLYGKCHWSPYPEDAGAPRRVVGSFVDGDWWIESDNPYGDICIPTKWKHLPKPPTE